MATPLVYEDCIAATMTNTSIPYGRIDDAAIVVSGAHIEWVGARQDLPDRYTESHTWSLGGRLVTPALLDCHTHLVYAGDRSAEFALRQSGVSYTDIAKQGGGILATVKATRAASDQELLDQSLTRLDALMQDGVAVVEIKSGYGLTIEHELRMLRVARELEQHRPVKVVTTWLAAHAVAPEYSGDADRYIDDVVIPGLRAAHSAGLVDAVDGFVEHIGFTCVQMRRVFDVAKSLGLPIKLHAEQLSDQGGAALVAEYGGQSADHLEYLRAAAVKQMAAANTVAVLLPGAFVMLSETQVPPIADFRQQRVSMAVATDCNPGSSPLTSLLTAMNLACTQFGLSPEEALLGTTKHAAAALGLDGQYGVITEGARADLAVWQTREPSSLSYWLAHQQLHGRIAAGEPTW